MGGKKKIEKRTKVKAFVKYVNYNHIMPTRYVVPTEFDAKSLVTDAQMDTQETKADARRSSSRSSTRSSLPPRRISQARCPKTSCTCARSFASRRSARSLRLFPDRVS